GRTLSGLLACATGDDPFQDAHVVSESRPNEFAVFALAEPIYAEDFGRRLELFPEREPMAEIIPHVIAAEGEHGKGIGPDFPHRPGRCGRGFRTHGRGQITSPVPIQSLISQGNRRASPAAENKGADGTPFGILPAEVDGWVLRRLRR